MQVIYVPKQFRPLTLVLETQRDLDLMKKMFKLFMTALGDQRQLPTQQEQEELRCFYEDFFK